MKSKNLIVIGIGALVLVIMAASASALITRNMDNATTPAVTAAVTPDATVQTSAIAAPRHETYRHVERSTTAQSDNIRWNDNRPVATPVAEPAAPPCNDHNVVGDVAGAAIGGLVGHNFGKGSGKTVATVGGALGGAVLGNQYIPTRNVACR